MGIVAVATPAGVVEGGGPHITAAEDLVIKAVRIASLGFGVLPANAVNTPRPANADWLNHNFIKFYMAGIETRGFITYGIANKVKPVNGGVGGLQYPTQGCSVVPPPPIPQPGPYYYRDDWGFPIPEEVGGAPSTFVPSPVKHLRDDVKGIAYTVRFIPFSSSGGNFLSEWGVSITIRDYVNGTVVRLATFPLSPLGYANLGNPVPDILLWSGGLLIIDPSYSSWRKITIKDGGVGTFPRWSLAPVQDGVITYPSYPVVDKGIVSPPNVPWQLKKFSFKQGARSRWTALGVAYRLGSYDYRIPFSAAHATWTNYPTGVFPGWGAVLPTPAVMTFQGEYGALDITDGNISFVKLGSAPLKIATGGAQVSPKPVVADYGVDISMAYIRTQPFLDVAGLVLQASSLYWPPSYFIDWKLNETALPTWQARYSYGRDVSGGGVLLADLPNAEGFFMPPWRNMHYLRFQASSLSDKMAVLFDKGFGGMFNNALLAKRYKLGEDNFGKGFMIVSDDPGLQQMNPPVTFPLLSPAANSILLSPTQKLFLESPSPAVP